MAGKLISLLLCTLIALCYALNETENDSKKMTRELYCWHGNDMSTKMNQSCSSKELHIANMVSSTTVPSDKNSTDSPINGTSLDTNSTASAINRCYMYETDESLKFVPAGNKMTSQQIIYKQSCDIEGYCNNQPMGEAIKMTIKNKTVNLYCCNTSNCNTHNHPKTALHCYTLLDQGSHKSGCINRCSSSKSACIISSNLSPTGQREFSRYDCDGEQKGMSALCAGFDSTKPGLTCINTTNNTEQLCCCFGNLCNKPGFDYTFLNDSRNCVKHPLNPVVRPTTVAPKHKGANPRRVDWLFIGGIIGAVALVILIIASVLIIVARYRRKSSQNNRLTLAYSRLAADRIPDDADDVQMLLS